MEPKGMEQGTSIIRIDDYDKDGKYITLERKRVKVDGDEIETFKLNFQSIFKFYISIINTDLRI